MFTNLIESESHAREFKRRSSFFLITVTAYAVILFAAGIASVYAYDAQLEAQTTDLIVDVWVPPVTPAPPKPRRDVQPKIRKPQSDAPVDPNIKQPERNDFVASTDTPNKIPEGIGVTPVNVIPYTPGAIKTDRNANPPVVPIDSNACVTCNSAPPVVEVDDKPPEPEPVKPPTTRSVSTGVLISKAINLPQPPYPDMAKRIRIQGPVNVQILVDEQGRVISAQAVSGHPTLTGAAKEAALRSRFTPTVLNGQAVKVQGVITYNFVLQ